MEHAPTKPSERPYAETFGIEPSVYERDIPETIRDLAPAIHKIKEESGEEIRKMFEGVYLPKEVDSDLAEVLRLQRVFNLESNVQTQESHLYAMVLELVIGDVAHAWFPDCVVWHASEYDDYRCGTDLFMDIPGIDGHPMTLALDVTSSRAAAQEKLKKTQELYQGGRFHAVKYFASDTDDARARGRAYMPRVIVGASRHEIVHLARLYGQWLHHNAIGSSLTKKEALERLQWHDVGGQVYEELLQQIASARDMMQKALKSTEEFKTARREELKNRVRYLEEVGNALEKRFKEWEKGQAEYLERNSAAIADVVALPNGVLETVQQMAW